MPLGSRVSLATIMLIASMARAQTAPTLDFGSRRAKDFVKVCDLNKTMANYDTVVTRATSSRVTLGLRLLNRVDKRLTKEFQKAWEMSKDGFDSAEGVVLVFLMPDGSYVGRSLGNSNEFEQASFKWDPAAVAIVHTHPNRISPRPSKTDEATADLLGVPVFTITSRGMYVFNPTTGETARVMDSLDWLEISKWTSRPERHHTFIDEYSDLSH
jgi:hypothetical protein